MKTRGKQGARLFGGLSGPSHVAGGHYDADECEVESDREPDLPDGHPSGVDCWGCLTDVIKVAVSSPVTSSPDTL